MFKIISLKHYNKYCIGNLKEISYSIKRLFNFIYSFISKFV